MKVCRRGVPVAAAVFVLCLAPMLWCAEAQGQEPVAEPLAASEPDDDAATRSFFDQTAAFPAGDDALGDAGFLSSPDDGNGSGSGLVLFLEVTMSLGIVLVVICLIVWLLRKFIGRTPMLLNKRVGRVVGRMYLSPKHVIYLVHLADRVLVVGVSAASMTCLAEITDETAVDSIVADGETFLNTLGRANLSMTAEHEPGAPPDTIEEHMEDIEGQITRLRALGENESETQ